MTPTADAHYRIEITAMTAFLPPFTLPPRNGETVYAVTLMRYAAARVSAASRPGSPQASLRRRAPPSREMPSRRGSMSISPRRYRFIADVERRQRQPGDGMHVALRL